MTTAMLARLDDAGYFIREKLVPHDLLAGARAETEPIAPEGRRRGGVRHAAAQFASCRDVAESAEVRGLMRELLGEGAVITRSILFDKNPESNWEVPWHRDMTIAVRSKPEDPDDLARLESLGFSPWSVKDGVPHVRAPESILERMVTIRIHLDDCTGETGALHVIPGTHVEREHVGPRPGPGLNGDPTTKPPGSVVCECPGGGALVMRPLLAHMSEKCKDGARRRVLHLECAGEPLPAPLRWAE